LQKSEESTSLYQPHNLVGYRWVLFNKEFNFILKQQQLLEHL